MAQDYVEIAMLGVSTAETVTAKNIANVYQFRRVITGSGPLKSQIDTAFQAAIGDIVLLALSVDYTQSMNTIRFFDDALDAPLPFTHTGVGGVAGQRSPDYVSATVRLKSNVKGRFARGRKSYGPIAESSTTGDHLTAGAITLFTNVAAAILAGFTDAGGNQWVPTVKSSLPPAQYTENPVTVVTYYVTAAIVNTNLGILKRRKVKV